MQGMNPGLDAVLGVLPSFFAAIYATIAFYMFVRRPLMAAAFGAACVAVTEIIQQVSWLPNYAFDPADIAAGILGAVAVVPLMWWHKPRTPSPQLEREAES